MLLVSVYCHVMIPKSVYNTDILFKFGFPKKLSNTTLSNKFVRHSLCGLSVRMKAFHYESRLRGLTEEHDMSFVILGSIPEWHRLFEPLVVYGLSH